MIILRGDIHFARFELAPVGFTDRNDTDSALSCYLEAEQKSPNHPLIAWVYYQIGRIHLSQNHVSQAEQSFERALAAPRRPANIYALCYERLGFIAFFEHREAQSALGYFQQALAEENQDSGWRVQLYMRLSSAYRELGNHQAALDAARRALREIQGNSSSSSRVTLLKPTLQLPMSCRKCLIVKPKR